MTTIKIRRALLYLFVLNAGSLQAQQLPQLGKSSINDVINAMTLEEKANLVVGNGFYLPDLAKIYPKMMVTLRPEQKKIIGTAGTTFSIPRLGIISLAESDGPSGVNIYNQSTGRIYYATSWPSPILQASSWDTALVKKIGVAYGTEAKEYGIDILLAPALNIHRNPLNGRNFEYYSEDPLIAGSMAAAMVNGIQSNGIGTSIKHFAANNQETNRNTVNAIVSERALREIYLKGFEIAVKKAHPWTVMSSYNLINGTYTSESRDLLTSILRGEWGFKGFVMTDWGGGKDPVAQMKAGNNLLMQGAPEQSKQIIDAVKSGALSESKLDENIAGILKVMLLSPSFKRYNYSGAPNLYKNAQISREAAAESMILLKNDFQTLPVNPKAHIISLFGTNGYDINPGGLGSGMVNTPYKVSLSEGLTRFGYTLERSLQPVYSTYVSQELLKRPAKSFLESFIKPDKPIEELAIDSVQINQAATASDLAIISIGRVSGEGADRKPDDLLLSIKEKQLIKKVSDAFHSQNKKVIVVLNVGGVIDVVQWRDQVDAILLAWLPGIEGGNAIVDVLSGKVNPSGKLATTFPVAYNDDPSAKNFPGKTLPKKDHEGGGQYLLGGVPAEVTYEEGIYVGYRYYHTFHKKAAYEFGYGLSYTSFAYSNLKLSAPTFNGKIDVTVTVNNTGKVEGREVAELYLSAPSGDLDKPSEELKGFSKTILLKPGQSQTLTFALSPKDLASFNTRKSAWIADAGRYEVKIGASSEDIKLTKYFILAKEIVVEKDHKALAPQVTIDELKLR